MDYFKKNRAVGIFALSMLASSVYADDDGVPLVSVIRPAQTEGVPLVTISKPDNTNLYRKKIVVGSEVSKSAPDFAVRNTEQHQETAQTSAKVDRPAQKETPKQAAKETVKVRKQAAQQTEQPTSKEITQNKKHKRKRHSTIEKQTQNTNEIERHGTLIPVFPEEQEKTEAQEKTLRPLAESIEKKPREKETTVNKPEKLGVPTVVTWFLYIVAIISLMAAVFVAFRLFTAFRKPKSNGDSIQWDD